jgi:hypothetical protein
MAEILRPKVIFVHPKCVDPFHLRVPHASTKYIGSRRNPTSFNQVSGVIAHRLNDDKSGL